MVEMQVATDILRFLFFPGLLFMAFCGVAVLCVEARMNVLFFGGEGLGLRGAIAWRGDAGNVSPGELSAMALSLASMGLAGILLVGVRGDLFVLALLFSAVEMLPLFIASESSVEEVSRVPLFFRTAFARLAALFCVIIAVSIRFPAEFSAGLETFRGEGAFYAIQLWSGVDFGLILASLVCAAAAFLVFLLGRPAYGGATTAGNSRYFYSLAAEGAERAAALLLLIVIFLGYPWDGWIGLLIWAAIALGTTLVLSAARAWLEGRDDVFTRRLQMAAPLLGLFSIALAFAAAV
jgi:hypothetical protein